MQTTCRKNLRGNWEVTSKIDLPNNRRLKIYTAKGSSGVLSSSASVCQVDGLFETFAMFQDYYKTVLKVKTRATEKAVREQHEEALKQLPFIMAEVQAQYGFSLADLDAADQPRAETERLAA